MQSKYPYVAVRDSQKSAELSLTSIPRQMYTQKQTHVYEARPELHLMTADTHEITSDCHTSSRGGFTGVGGKECTWKLGHVCAQVVCPHAATAWRSCTSVPGLARLCFQEKKVMRTCATAVDKQY